VTAGIGAIAHGTDIAGSIRYPAYACGVHGLRPTLGRVPTFNASLPERTIGGQIGAVSGPLARSIADIRLALAVMAARDVRDPWWVPAPLVGPPVERCAAICVAPDGLDTKPEVAHAVRDAGIRLEAAGWHVGELAVMPPLAEAADAQANLVFADGYANMLDRAEREGRRRRTQLRGLPDQRQRSALALIDAYRVPEQPLLGAVAPTAVFREAVRSAEVGQAHDIPHVDVALIRKYAVDVKALGLV
jgi:amidase